MTQRDKQLIDKASHLHAVDWFMVVDMEKEAESDEAKQILHDRATHLYHVEEYYAGLL